MINRNPADVTEPPKPEKAAIHALTPNELGLGHETISIIMDTYSHVIKGMQKEAVQSLVILLKIKMGTNRASKHKKTTLEGGLLKWHKAFKFSGAGDRGRTGTTFWIEGF